MKQLLVAIAAVLAFSGCAPDTGCTPSRCTETPLGGGLACQACGVESPKGSCYLVTCVCIPFTTTTTHGCACQEDGTFATTPTAPSPCEGRNY